MPWIIALTGGIACGKSTVGLQLEKLGLEVFDADEVAHACMARGTAIFCEVVNHFGTDILDEVGELCRPVLAKRVFADRQEMQWLNELVHPAVRYLLLQWMEQCRNKRRCGVAVIPLLFESGWEQLGWHLVVCVAAQQKEVLKRLQERGLSDFEAQQRIAAQMSLEEKMNRADTVIENYGTKDELTRSVEQCAAVWLKEGKHEWEKKRAG